MTVPPSPSCRRVWRSRPRVRRAAAGGGRGGIDLWVTAFAPLSQDVFSPEINVGEKCGRYGRRRRRLPCFYVLQLKGLPP
ncbi:unnamed protein product [Ectocarpus fasciculatus]